jgi:outer membrane receptor protein involved in Fe transport
VTDPTGAVVPDADITAREVTTGLETKTRSNNEGIYQLPRLKPGLYTIAVQKQGYKRQEFQQVNVQIGADTTIEAVLQAGQVSETVTVTATGEELLQKEQVQISNTFEERKVADLPANGAGAGIDTLALLAPGVVPGFGNVNSNGTTLSVNGNRARSNNFTIDGGDNNDLSIGGPSFFVDNADSVAQFSVVTNNFSAEYGRNQGAIVNIVTKQGTNAFHGNATWYHQNNNFLNSLNNIEKRGGNKTGPDPGIYNLWDGTFGGPIKKDRLFFFGSFQYITLPANVTLQSGSPTIAPQSLGPLSAAYPNNAAVQALTHLSAFAIPLGNPVPRADKPQGTVVIGGVSYATAYPQRVVGEPFSEPEFGVRGDFKINDKNSIWYRQLYQKANNTNSLAGSAGFTGNIPASGRLGTASFTTQISNTAVNEFRFTSTRLAVVFGGGCSGPNCIPDPASILSTVSRINFTGLHDSSGVSLQSIGAATNLPQGRIVNSYQFTDNFSKIMGRHQVKVGADIRRLTNSVPFLPNVNGSFTFSSAARLAANDPSTVQLAVGKTTLDYTETDTYFYGQDDWKIKDNLTFNLGVRYEYSGQPINLIHDLTVARESNPSTATWLQSLPLDVRTFPKIPAATHNFAPRLGFAYTPRFSEGRFAKWLFGEQDRTVISGGYSIAYDPAFYNILLNVSTSSPVVFLNTTSNPAPGGTVLFPLPNAVPTGSSVHAFASSAGLIASNTFDPRTFNRTIVSPNFHSPYSQQWSFRLQREFSRNNVVEIRYVGTHGVGLFETLNANPRFDRLYNGFSAGGFNFPAFKQLIPAGLVPLTCSNIAGNPNNFASCNGREFQSSLVRSRENTSQSIYHGLQTHWQGRIASQLSVGASYTFAKALDNASEIFSFTEIAVPQDPFSRKNERGYSGFDRRHAMALNFIWDAPFFKNKQGWMRTALGGWQLNGTYFLASGQRYTAQSQFNTFFVPGYSDATFDNSFFGEDSQRPFVGSLSAPRGSVGISGGDALLAGLVDPSVAKKVSPTAFYSMNALNASNGLSLVTVSKDQVRYIVNGPMTDTIFGTPFGNALRNNEMGPILNNVNLGVFKNFRIKERITFQARLEAFNALNHPNPGVGSALGAGLGSALPNAFVEQAGSPDGFADFGGITYARRVVQVGFKLIF